MSHCGNDETGHNALCGRYLNNMRTGKDATKPRTLGLLRHSGYCLTGILSCISFRQYYPGKRVLIQIKDLEMTSSFLGSDKHITLLEADAVLRSSKVTRPTPADTDSRTTNYDQWYSATDIMRIKNDLEFQIGKYQSRVTCFDIILTEAWAEVWMSKHVARDWYFPIWNEGLFLILFLAEYWQ